MKTVKVRSRFLRANTFYAIAWGGSKWACAIAGTHFDAKRLAWCRVLDQGVRLLREVV